MSDLISKTARSASLIRPIPMAPKPVVPSRRQLLAAAAGTAVTLGATNRSPATTSTASPPGTNSPPPEPFRFCLNTSTIREQKLGILEEAKLAAKVGYSGIEPWLSELQTFQREGGSLKDLGKQISDLGLTVESAIAFSNWIVDDEAERTEALEKARREMEMLSQIGGKRIAAPPVGAHRGQVVDLNAAANRYRALLEVGDETGIVPQVEVWGFSSSLSKLGEAVYVAIESGHPKACLLADVYHLHKGGSRFTGLGLLNSTTMQVFHINDYPADPGRTEITDAHRVYPGDGVAPIDQILTTLIDAGGQTVLSLELFNPEYWKQDAETVLRTGLEKMKASVAQAVG